MSDQTASYVYTEAGTFYPQVTCGGYTATFAEGVTVEGLPAPTGVTATATGENTIDVEWEAVEGADSYTITYWPSDDPDAEQSVDSTETSATLEDLTPATEYTITVRAVDVSGGGGEESDPVTATTEGEADPLPTPQDVTATDIGDDSAIITWGEVEDAESYTVTWALADDPETPVGTAEVDAPETTADATGLEPDTDYVATVVAHATGRGDSDPGTVEFTTTGDAGPQLPTPENIIADPVGDETATVSWDEVEGADGYTYELDPDDGDNPSGELTEATVDLTGLVSGTDYTISVVATDSTGEASDSDPGEGEFATTGEPPEPLPTPEDVAAADVTDTTADISWSEVEGADGYDVTWYPTGDPGSSDMDTAEASPYQIDGLDPETDYTVEVVATDSTGEATDSDPGTAEFTTEPSEGPDPLPTPEDLDTGEPTAEGTTVSWSAVEGADGYTVSWYPTDDPESSDSAEVTDPTVDITGLESDTEYTVEVVATDSTGEATDSDPASGTFTTTGDTPQLDTPTDIITSDVTDTSATIAWESVESADGYDVTFDPADGEVAVDPASDSAEATGLTPETQYTVSVVATDSTEAYADSEPGTAEFTTEPADTPEPLPTPADIDTGTPNADGTTVSWTAVDGADGYTVSWASAADPETPIGSEDVTDPTVDITGLEAETEYVVSVVATDSTGETGDSDPGTAEFTTAAD